ncbi:hypothetical protein Cyagr_0171 [Cyanobium gracile PCC 6307]|uniref:Uncharacterized protein n=1 Tax=Cyanobium gracile (strain ATCC 27147 / PCC 6307) TaxID=292564 RepID=K9P4B4_CYAGP|nr:hypothetical protein Cyagr_0171 [Cyanobium gracile PCC 6307]
MHYILHFPSVVKVLAVIPNAVMHCIARWPSILKAITSTVGTRPRLYRPSDMVYVHHPFWRIDQLVCSCPLPRLHCVCQCCSKSDIRPTTSARSNPLSRERHGGISHRRAAPTPAHPPPPPPCQDRFRQARSGVYFGYQSLVRSLTRDRLEPWHVIRNWLSKPLITRFNQCADAEAASGDLWIKT